MPLLNRGPLFAELMAGSRARGLEDSAGHFARDPPCLLVKALPGAGGLAGLKGGCPGGTEVQEMLQRLRKPTDESPRSPRMCRVTSGMSLHPDIHSFTQ